MNNVASLVDLCPKFRYLKCQVECTLREFSRAASQEERQTVTGQALALARIISNVIEPMARDCQPNFVTEYHHLAERLYDLARPWVQFHPSDFPQSDKTQLLIDRIDELDARVRELLQRRQRRQSHGLSREAA